MKKTKPLNMRLHCTLHTTHCTLNNAHFTLQPKHYTLLTARCTLNSLTFTPGLQKCGMGGINLFIYQANAILPFFSRQTLLFLGKKKKKQD